MTEASYVIEPVFEEQPDVAGAPVCTFASVLGADNEGLATGLQFGASHDTKELDDLDVELLCRFADGDAVLSELQEQPSLRAPALVLASRLMAAGANSNVAFLPIVQGL
eukprot:6410867-Pyramimonas_sp.AAC.1